jgi:hypothetical protein
MREDQIDQAGKLRVTLQDADLRRRQQEQSGTFFAHALAQAGDLAGGRFGAATGGAPHVVGSVPVPKYPAAGSHQHDPVGTEPPLGVDAMSGFEPSAVSVTAAEDSGAPAGAAPSSTVAPPSDDGELGDAGAPPFMPAERR